MTTNAFGLEGQVLVGRYRLIRPLSSGSMGTVWRADDLTLGSPVAIKMLGPLYAKDEAVRARFYQEAQAAAALRSPNVVQILDHGVDNEVPFIAMELLEGEDLSHRIQRVGPLSPADTARIFADVARAVRKAHDAGIVHRDLKPENIFLARDDDREVAKVLDFGVAKTRLYGNEGMGTQVGVLIGTLPYMSPEQAQGASVDHRSDLWALGVIAFECVCGRAAITAEAPGAMILEICSEPLPIPSQVAPAPVPPAFDEWFLQACSRDPAARFPSATAMAEALHAALLPAGEAQETGRASVASAVHAGPISVPPASAPPASAQRASAAPASAAPASAAPASTAPASAPPASVAPASAAPASAALASAAPASAAPASAAPASTAPASAAPASAPPVSGPPSGDAAPQPSLAVVEAEVDWKPRRTRPVAVALGLAASVVGVWLLVGRGAPDGGPAAPGSGPTAPDRGPAAPEQASRAEAPPVAINTPRTAAPTNVDPAADVAPAREAPELAPSPAPSGAAAVTPAAQAASARGRAPAPSATWAPRALSDAAAAPARQAAAAATRQGKAAPSAQRTKTQAASGGAPPAASAPVSSDRRLGF
ncbi:protein kinase domain-containing protein [Sorangium sp. So ce1097]|uniref:serine/threonine-protein kinase n=1 Tax=Sorangium sp. So ce1097 TaxID=3133330 RepID=UPI003F5FFFCD